MNIKEEILEIYPSIIFNNEIFLDEKKEKILKDFTLEDIAFRLSKLDEEAAWKLNMYLYNYSISNIERSIIKFLVKNNVSYFNSSSDDIYKQSNLIKEFDRVSSGIDYTVDDLKNSINDNIKNNSNKEFYQFDISHFNCIIMIQKLYKEKKVSIDELKDFINFIVEILRKKTIDVYGNYDSKYEGYVNEVISYLISGNVSLEDYSKSMSYNNPVLDLLVSAKFGGVSNVNTLPIDVVMALKAKRVNNFVNKIMARKIGGFNRNRVARIVINMCTMLGEVSVDNIIKNLNNDDYCLRNLLFSFDDIDLSNVEVIDREIVYNSNFIKFFMGNKMNDPTSLLNLIYENKTNLGHHLENLYYSFGSLYERYLNQDKLSKKVYFEEFLRNSKMCFNPDEYELEGHVINTYFDNRQHQSLKSVDFVKGVRDSYGEMKHNYQKSIPYVKGEMFGYTYETLRADSPLVYSVGADTGCCFKIGGQADSFVRYCAEDKNARVIAIRNKSDKVVAMIPIVRNGNLVVCNSIESNNIKSVSFMEKMFQILESVGNDIINVSIETEGRDRGIQAVLCGNYKNFIEQFNKYKKIDYGMEFNKISPLNSGVSCNLGMDAHECYCISSIDNFDFDNALVYEPEVLYNDPRRSIYELEVDSLSDEEIKAIQKRIDSICYESNYQKVRLDNAIMVIFSNDWFIVVDNKNNIYSSIVGKDKRAYLEYEEYLDLEKEYYSSYSGEMSSRRSM